MESERKEAQSGVGGVAGGEIVSLDSTFQLLRIVFEWCSVLIRLQTSHRSREERGEGGG